MSYARYMYQLRKTLLASFPLIILFYGLLIYDRKIRVSEFENYAQWAKNPDQMTVEFLDRLDKDTINVSTVHRQIRCLCTTHVSKLKHQKHYGRVGVYNAYTRRLQGEIKIATGYCRSCKLKLQIDLQNCFGKLWQIAPGTNLNLERASGGTTFTRRGYPQMGLHKVANFGSFRCQKLSGKNLWITTVNFLKS